MRHVCRAGYSSGCDYGGTPARASNPLSPLYLRVRGIAANRDLIGAVCISRRGNIYQSSVETFVIPSDGFHLKIFREMAHLRVAFTFASRVGCCCIRVLAVRPPWGSTVEGSVAVHRVAHREPCSGSCLIRIPSLIGQHGMHCSATHMVSVDSPMRRAGSPAAGRRRRRSLELEHLSAVGTTGKLLMVFRESFKIIAAQIDSPQLRRG